MKMRVEALEPVDITKSPCWQAWQQGKIIGRQEAIDQCIAALPPAKGMPGVGPGWWSERPTGYNQARADAIKALEALRDQPGARGAGD
jgi:hypothetical protein